MRKTRVEGALMSVPVSPLVMLIGTFMSGVMVLPVRIHPFKSTLVFGVGTWGSLIRGSMKEGPDPLFGGWVA